jgi:hypothetical protein
MNRLYLFVTTFLLLISLTPCYSLPDPAKKQRPNRTKPGGGLSPQAQVCQQSKDKLQVLIPVENPVSTFSNNPSILVYIPFSSGKITQGEISVLTQDEKTRIYQARFLLPQVPGIVSIPLTGLPHDALKKEQYFSWYLSLYCQGNKTGNPDFEMDGYLIRTSIESDREYQRMVDSGIYPSFYAALLERFYDSISDLYNQLSMNPQDAVSREKFVKILARIEAAELADKPLVGTVTFLEKAPK